MKPISAALDLIVVIAVTAGLWSLRFLDVISDVGPIVMAAALVLVFIILKMRREPAASIGLGPLPPPRRLFTEAGWLLPRFALVWLVGGGLAVALLGQPETSGAVTQLSDNVWLFLLDVTVITWVLIGFGEEVLFRGFILHRLLALTGESRRGRIVACGLQAAFFGSLHASQGAAGVVMTGMIGFIFAWYYLGLPKRTLWPLILVHAATDTIVLSVSWFLS